MFNTLDATWDRSARRRLSTLASFIFQGLALSLLFAIPLFWIEGPPQLRLSNILAPPPAAQAPAPQPHEHAQSPSNLSQGHAIQPWVIPNHVAILHESSVPAPPDLGGVRGGSGTLGVGVRSSIGDALNNFALPPPAPVPAQAHPLRISHMAAGDLIYRVQPQYPEIAREAHIQGMVQLRAIISKAGTIENLIAEGGHPMLVPAAIKAVRQWRYRPYMLNGQPVEVETEITVNFVLGR